MTDAYKNQNEAHILASWHRNASPWINALRAHAIASRRQVTDQAIIDAVMAQAPRSVLDVGCGEGWLLRALSDKGISLVGVDAVPELVEAARTNGSDDVYCLNYDQLAAGALLQKFDVLVCNFSLLGEESVQKLITAMPSWLTAAGVLIIQTVHPLVVCGDAPYQAGWRSGSWAGLATDVAQTFIEPPPWYFRTLSDWLRLFTDAGGTLKLMREPTLAGSNLPASVIFVVGFERASGR